MTTVTLHIIIVFKKWIILQIFRKWIILQIFRKWIILQIFRWLRMELTAGRLGTQLTSKQYAINEEIFIFICFLFIIYFDLEASMHTYAIPNPIFFTI